MHPETLPDTEISRLYIAGHETTYADSLWIRLIQYIGDNLRDDGYKVFLHPMIERIYRLHPHFATPYNIALILTPNLREESPNYQEDKAILERAIQI
jgi:hypothetical protein